MKEECAIIECKEEESYIRNILQQAIISDLADEILTYSQHKWRGDFPKLILKSKLILLDMFLNNDFSQIMNTEKGQQFMHDLLLKFYFFTRKLPSIPDKIMLPILKRRKYLSDIVIEKLEILQKQLNFNLKGEVKQYGKNSAPRKVILNGFSSPYASIEFDHTSPLPVVFNDHLLPYTPCQSSFKEGRHFFPTNEERNQSINSYEGICKFN